MFMFRLTAVVSTEKVDDRKWHFSVLPGQNLSQEYTRCTGVILFGTGSLLFWKVVLPAHFKSKKQFRILRKDYVLFIFLAFIHAKKENNSVIKKNIMNAK